MKLSDITAQRLASNAVTPLLASRIKGRSDVEPLRLMLRGMHKPEDMAIALDWTRSELRAVCYEDWGPTHLQLADDILWLRIKVMAMLPKKEEEPATPEIAPQPIPCNDGLEYLPFQVEGIRWALQHQHSLIADEPGLGKTIQALGVINALDPKRIVVVCPAHLKINWQREAEAWLTRKRSIGIASGNDFPDVEMLILNYDIADRKPLTLIERGIDLLVLDEVHFIKSPSSARTIACKKLIKAAKRGLYLSGTPLLNRPIELYPLLAAINSPLAGDYPRRYCDARMKDVYIAGGGGKKRRVYDDSGASNIDELKAKLRESFMIRRLKSEVLTELPERTRRMLALPDVAGADKIAARASELLREVDIEGIVSGEKPQPLDTGALALARHEEALAKLPEAADYAHELLEDEGVQKLVIFAHHRDVIEGMFEAMKDFSPAMLYGGMSPTDKQAAIDRFQADDSCRVFVGSILAAGTGITLTAASRMLFIELDWVPANLDQAESRCHRKTQRNAVLCEYLVVPGGIDERICRALLRKQAILDAAI